MDFNSVCLLRSPSLAMRESRHVTMMTSSLCLFIVTENEQEEGGSPAAILVSLRNFKPLLLGSQCIF